MVLSMGLAAGCVRARSSSSPLRGGHCPPLAASTSRLEVWLRCSVHVGCGTPLFRRVVGCRRPARVREGHAEARRRVAGSALHRAWRGRQGEAEAAGGCTRCQLVCGGGLPDASIRLAGASAPAPARLHQRRRRRSSSRRLWPLFLLFSPRGCFAAGSPSAASAARFRAPPPSLSASQVSAEAGAGARAGAGAGACVGAIASLSTTISSVAASPPPAVTAASVAAARARVCVCVCVIIVCMFLYRDRHVTPRVLSRYPGMI